MSRLDKTEDCINSERPRRNMAQRALCRLSVMRSMMSRTNSLKTSRRLQVQPCAYMSTEQGPGIFNVQDSDDFKERVLESKTPTVVDFHAGWCGPCKLLGPRLEEVIAATKGKVQLAKVDIDDNTDLAIDYNVEVVPTVLAVKDGKITDKFMGLLEADKLKLFVEKMY